MTNRRDILLMTALLMAGLVGIGVWHACFPDRETAWAIGLSWGLVGLIHIGIYWVQVRWSRVGEALLIPAITRLVALPLILIGLVVGLRPVLSWFLVGFLGSVLVFMTLQIALVLRNLRR